MGKAWFNKLVQREPTDLAKTIAELLKKDPPPTGNGSAH